ncbi:hypothetical protein CAL13_05445 [Bordetella genomosp. 9]|uniref:OmpR/PhoB-type domain-containing protein n=2 Tax=Bordetella genomosp. 9 TaxID=1416803 RepID=A0A1W6YXT5_9BORD|nr:hypothetical protein CAL13_05445 [Bordetella genomosp. 9]ARP89687.1 hypothetical protein CAL14_04820 [Bordetella genomosp. 9]
MQLEADLRKLASTVHLLSSFLGQGGGFSRFGAAGADDRIPETGQTGARWRLREGGWTLVSPHGQRLALTTLERKFMIALFEAPKRSLPRNDVGILTTGRGDANGKSTSPRGVDVMVSRLRRKAQAVGMPLPLRSVRRWGYMFTEEAEVE